MLVYKFHPETKEYLYAVEAYIDPLETKKQKKDIYLLPANATFIQPLDYKEQYAIVWNGESWEYIEDHRVVYDTNGKIIKGTPYWLKTDSYDTPARYMTELGALPNEILFVVPEKPLEVIQRELEKHYTNLIQSLLDKEAQKLGYDNCLSVCSYMDTGVQKFDDEGSCFRKWRSAVWNTGYEILDKVKSGKMEIPSEEELIKMLPKLEIVYSK
jgi:hypothetical protein